MSGERNHRRLVWLLAAALLLGLSAWLMSRGDRERPTARAPRVTFPRQPKDAELERNGRRRTLPPAPAADSESVASAQKRDPLLVALPVDPKRSALVFEVGALKESAVGKAWLDCMLERTDRDRRGLAKFKDSFGVDPVNDVERVAVSSAGVAVLQGSLGGARFERDGWAMRTYGEHGRIYEDASSGRTVAMWGDDMMLVGRDVETIEDSIDRLESTDPIQAPIIDDQQGYGDIYGVLSPDDLAKAVPDEQANLASQITELVERVEIHVVASEDVAMVADVMGPGGEEMDDLAKSFGTALALARVKAQSDEDDKLAELLDSAKVKPGSDRFAVDVALPAELLKDMGPCRQRGPRD